LSYAQALKSLYQLQSSGVRLGLDRMQTALRARGEPHLLTPCVHVAGTNGKGSTCTFLASMAKAAGIRVGLFTSPHLHKLTERFTIDGIPVGTDEITQRITELLDFLGRKKVELSFFEACTVLAFEIFSEHHCELAIYEVGLGGRLDATNVVRPLVTAVTSIGLDHMQLLGDTLSAIATEKAGIIKANTPLVLGALSEVAKEVLTSRAEQLDVRVFSYPDDYGFEETAELCFATPQQRTGPVTLGLGGDFQKRNAACALMLASCLRSCGFDIDHTARLEGLRNAHWPGRFEIIEGAPRIMFDVCHNAHASAQLAIELRRINVRPECTVMIFAAMKDKDIDPMLADIMPFATYKIFASLAMERAFSAENLALRYHGECAATPRRALEMAKTRTGEDGFILVTGSIFLVADIRAQWLGLPSDPPIAF